MGLTSGQNFLELEDGGIKRGAAMELKDVGDGLAAEGESAATFLQRGKDERRPA